MRENHRRSHTKLLAKRLVFTCDSFRSSPIHTIPTLTKSNTATLFLKLPDFPDCPFDCVKPKYLLLESSYKHQITIRACSNLQAFFFYFISVLFARLLFPQRQIRIVGKSSVQGPPIHNTRIAFLIDILEAIASR